MADDVEVELDDLDPDTPSGAGRPKPFLLVIVAAVGLVGGGLLGMKTLAASVGPVLADRAEASGTPAGGDHGEEGGPSEGPAAIHMIDNFVVNPARSGGTRLLLTSIAVEVVDPGAIASVAARDVEMRAALILVLGAKTVEELTDVSLREGIVHEIEAALATITGPGVIRRVFIPQFVIQ